MVTCGNAATLSMTYSGPAIGYAIASAALSTRAAKYNAALVQIPQPGALGRIAANSSAAAENNQNQKHGLRQEHINRRKTQPFPS